MDKLFLGIPFLLIFIGGIPSLSKDWNFSVKNSSIVRRGLERLNTPYYQYEVIGLGGTVLRPGPDGFTVMRAPGIPSIAEEGLDYRPYLINEYWWSDDLNGRRIDPFDLEGNYGEYKIQVSDITYFRHFLDISKGLLEIELGLKGEIGSFRSIREEFVTPEGILVIRIRDLKGVKLPFRLKIVNKPFISSYFHRYYAPNSPPFRFSASKYGDEVLLLSAKREGACKAVMALAIDTISNKSFIDVQKQEIGSRKAGDEIVFYIALASSYECEDPEVKAREMAIKAKQRGYENLLNITAKWWQDFYNRSRVIIPDPELEKWYIRSLYYHGVYFGNASIPPGMWGTSPAGYAGGAIILEYDIVFSQLALVYTNHLEEARKVVDWLFAVLPQAEKNAKYSKLYDVVCSHKSGAKYGWSSGWDGRISIPLAAFEEANLYNNFPSLNAAAIALRYADWAVNPKYEQVANRILKETTEVAVEDLVWREDFGGYLDKHAPHALQQFAAIFGLTETLRRGIADANWREILDKIIIPKSKYKGQDVISLGFPPPNELPEGSGDAPWLIGLWWYGVLKPDDPTIENTYEMIKGSKTGEYVFNRGWMAVYAAKLGKSEDAYKWVKSLIEPNKTIYDDTSIVEAVSDTPHVCAFARCPELGAHGALICAISQMLVDGDDRERIILFPAVPIFWTEAGLSFSNFTVNGGLAVSADLNPRKLVVKIKNNSDKWQEREISINLPDKWEIAIKPPSNFRLEENRLIIPQVKIAPGAQIEFVFHFHQ